MLRKNQAGGKVFRGHSWQFALTLPTPDRGAAASPF
jgi:hypothetical protein